MTLFHKPGRTWVRLRSLWCTAASNPLPKLGLMKGSLKSSFTAVCHSAWAGKMLPLYATAPNLGNQFLFRYRTFRVCPLMKSKETREVLVEKGQAVEKVCTGMCGMPLLILHNFAQHWSSATHCKEYCRQVKGYDGWVHTQCISTRPKPKRDGSSRPQQCFLLHIHQLGGHGSSVII